MDPQSHPVIPATDSRRFRGNRGDATRLRDRQQLLRIILGDASDTLARKLAADENVYTATLGTGASAVGIAAQRQSGHTGFVWPPQFLPDALARAVPSQIPPSAVPFSAVSLSVARALAATPSPMRHPAGRLRTTEDAALLTTAVRSATAWLSAGDVHLAQALLPIEDLARRESFEEAGYTHLTNLLYLVRETQDVLDEPATRLTLLLPLTESDFAAGLAEFRAVLEQTYVDSKDCPAIKELQGLDDAIANYQGIGQFSPDNWFLVRRDQIAVGTLILAEHGSGANLTVELVYVGISPRARGQQLGGEVVRHALRIACERGATRMVLAVDAANQPALGMYAACGFGVWDERAVMVRRLAAACSAGSARGWLPFDQKSGSRKP